MKRRNVRLNTILRPTVFFVASIVLMVGFAPLASLGHGITGNRSAESISHTFSPEEIARTEEYWTPERMAEAIPAEMPGPEDTSIKFTFWIGVALACIALADAFNSLRKWIVESRSEA